MTTKRRRDRRRLSTTQGQGSYGSKGLVGFNAQYWIKDQRARLWGGAVQKALTTPA